MPERSATVAPPRRRRAAVIVVLLAASAVLALGLTHVARRQRGIRIGYALSTDTTELRRLEEENRRLRLERSMLRHPRRIERLAVELGMARPDPHQIRVAPGRGGTVAAQ